MGFSSASNANPVARLRSATKVSRTRRPNRRSISRTQSTIFSPRKDRMASSASMAAPSSDAAPAKTVSAMISLSTKTASESKIELSHDKVHRTDGHHLGPSRTGMWFSKAIVGVSHNPSFCGTASFDYLRNWPIASVGGCRCMLAHRGRPEVCSRALVRRLVTLSRRKLQLRMAARVAAIRLVSEYNLAHCR
jgi:hypothetical protein